jgi:hypothetical protein
MQNNSPIVIRTIKTAITIPITLESSILINWSSINDDLLLVVAMLFEAQNC